MKNLSTFITDTFIKKDINRLFEDCIYIDNIEMAEKTAKSICCGNIVNVVFETSIFKNRFINVLSSLMPNINIINCNCSKNRFLENDFTGFLVFNNLKFCKHKEIIEEIKKNYKGVMIL